MTAGLRDETVELHPTAGGWWDVTPPQLEHGDDYGFSIDGGELRPDPRSLWQPSGVHGRSRVYDHSLFEWGDSDWRGRPLAGSVIYELHIGTFTADGTFDAAIERLDHLVDLGIDCVEVLPVAAFDGAAGWGYDGVAIFAAHEPYGGPDGFKRFVDACHSRGLAVILDVVYNHFGPSGNYLATFGPYLTDAHHTPWGSAVNLDDGGSDEVRAFIVDNVMGWLAHFHVDGLRLDAVHELVDNRAVHILEELSRAVGELGARLGRDLFLIAESDLNDPRVITQVEAGGLGIDAQWTDDVHHSLHSAFTGEKQGYYADFGSLAAVATTMESAFFHADTFSAFRDRRHGRPVDRLHTPGHRFVTYLQDHDQVGNRACGDRLAAALSPALLKVASTLLFTSPFTPQLFMGEEWAASTPWQFFTSFPDTELGAAVTKGRREEFAAHGWDGAEIPDPQAADTFEASKLDWSEVDEAAHQEMLDWHRDLIAMRKSQPALSDGRLDQVRCSYDDAERWFVMLRGRVAVVCNLSDERREVPVDGTPRELHIASAPGFVYREGIVELDGPSVVVVSLLG